MQKINSLVKTLLAIALVGMMTVPVSAAFAGNHGGGTSEVKADFSKYIESNEPSDNVELSIFTKINFVSDQNGNLIAPSEDSMRIENQSIIGVSVDTVQVTPTNGWNLVKNASETEESNAISFNFGPEDDMISAYDCADKLSLANDHESWKMTDYAGDHTTVPVLVYGKIANLENDFVTKSQAAVVRMNIKAEWPDRVFR